MTPESTHEMFWQEGFDGIARTSRARIAALVKRLWPVRTHFRLVRYGGSHDGGYLVPDDLLGIAACYSPGVGQTATFEQDLLQRVGIVSHLADGDVDHTPNGFVPASFVRRNLGAVDDGLHMTLASWVSGTAGLATTQDLLLQVDIEGGEYAVLLSTPTDILRKFRIIVIEFHGVEQWIQPLFFMLVESIMHKLLQDFHVVHNHPNNFAPLVSFDGFVAPAVFEMTLLRRDRSEDLGFRSDFPHSLDAPNSLSRPDVPLPPGWYAQARIATDATANQMKTPESS